MAETRETDVMWLLQHREQKLLNLHTRLQHESPCPKCLTLSLNHG